MKTKKIIVALGLLITVVTSAEYAQAGLSSVWTDPASTIQQVTVPVGGNYMSDVWRTSDGANQYFRLTLNQSSLQDLSTYGFGIVFSNASLDTIGIPATYFTDLVIPLPGDTAIYAGAFKFSNGSLVALPSAQLHFDDLTSTLEWKISNGDMTGLTWWQARGVKGTVDLATSALIARSSSAATPIPGAAWLLGSGIIGLIGIRRRKAMSL